MREIKDHYRYNYRYDIISDNLVMINDNIMNHDDIMIFSDTQ